MFEKDAVTGSLSVKLEVYYFLEFMKFFEIGPLFWIDSSKTGGKSSIKILEFEQLTDKMKILNLFDVLCSANIEVFLKRVQRRIRDPVKRLWWSVFAKKVNGF